MRVDLRKLRGMKKYDGNSQINVVRTTKDGDVFLALTEEVAKSKWVMDSIAAKHIYQDRTMFDTLKTSEVFGHFMLGNGDKMKVEGIGSMRVKFHNCVMQTFYNVRYIPYVASNIISLADMFSQSYKFVGSKWDCKVYTKRYLVLREQKNEKNICYLEQQSLKKLSVGRK
ncbi:uncharacterized protein [Cicer arietinum]|uniref:uncharacterized protein n=1 Tax=Cicer arietinum TaxID=3827 RepID=UPI003CC5DA86